MPAGTAFESTDKIISAMTEHAKTLREKYTDPETNESVIRNIYSISGGRNSTMGRVRIDTVPPEKRNSTVTTGDIVKEWRQLVGQVAGAEQLNYRAEIGGWGGAPLNIELKGRDLSQVARQVRQAVFGFEVQRVQRGREEVRVMVRYPLEARQSIETLEQMMIRIGPNQEVPLWQVANIQTGVTDLPNDLCGLDAFAV
jgi:multidrug efflux pump subunit AcrB